MNKLPGKAPMTVYNVNFHRLEDAQGWRCQAPLHEAEPDTPPAVVLCMILVSEALARKEIIVNQAHYACRDCMVTMKQDMGAY